MARRRTNVRVIGEKLVTLKEALNRICPGPSEILLLAKKSIMTSLITIMDTNDSINTDFTALIDNIETFTPEAVSC